MSAIAGRVLLIPKGAYNALTLYAMLDVVSYNGNSYVAKKSTQGNTPSADTEYWMILASGTAVASINDIGDVLITSATNGQVLKYDATLQRWVNGEDTGGLLPHLVITSETGATVTVVKGGDTITATETSTGVYECDVPEFGTYTCHSLLNGDDATVDITVDTVKVYSVNNSHFSATITVTFPTGATCSCGKAGETPQTASVSPHTFTVHSAGTYTVSATDGTSTDTETVSIVNDGQTESVTLSFVPDGKTVTPVNDITIWQQCAGISSPTYTTLSEILADTGILATLMADNNAVDYLVRSKTFAVGNEALVPTLSGTDSNVINSTQSTGYEAWKAYNGTNTSSGWLPSSSDSVGNAYVGYHLSSKRFIGQVDVYLRRNTPTSVNNTVKIQGSNDGTNWTDISSALEIAYTDTQYSVNCTPNQAYEYVRMLITASSNIIAGEGYHIQFYSASAICDNSTAMSYIGLNNYCANTLLADSDWCEAICNSTYFESVLNVKVPVMTGNTTPSGVCSGSTKYTGRDYYQAFDGDSSTYWYAHDSDIPAYIQYQFTSAVKVKYVVFDVSGGTDPSQARVKDYDIKADGVVVYSGTHQTTSATEKAYLYNNETSAAPWQVYVKNMWGGARIGLNQLQFYGRADV